MVPIHKWFFGQISAPARWNVKPIPLGLCSKNNPRNIKHMPVVMFFAGLDLKQKISFLDGHYLSLFNLNNWYRDVFLSILCKERNE
jgi:hypothetical protein